jgi:transcriptional regulator with XRE-family HTH domain
MPRYIHTMDSKTTNPRHKLAKVIGAKIVARRTWLGLGQADLGRQVGLSWQMISKYEQGHNLPDALLLRRLGKALNCPAGYFFGEVD